MTDDLEDFAEGPDHWLDIIIGEYAAIGGEAMLGVIIGSGLLIGLYIHSEDMALPTVVLILLSGVLFGTLPGDYQQTAMSVLIIGMAAGIWQVTRRYIW